MRIAAGTLMIILGTIMGTFVALVELTLSEGSMNYARFILFPIIPAVFVITGGVFCLKRKDWKLCFTSSLVLLLLDLYLFLAFNFRYIPLLHQMQLGFPLRFSIGFSPLAGFFQ
jgi:hypothetical protein